MLEKENQIAKDEKLNLINEKLDWEITSNNSNEEFLINDTHFMCVSSFLLSNFEYFINKNSFKIISISQIKELKKLFTEKYKNEYFLLRVSKSLINPSYIVKLIEKLNLKNVTLYENKEVNTPIIFTFVYNRIIYYGALAPRIFEENDDNDYNKFFSVTFNRKTNLRNL